MKLNSVEHCGIKAKKRGRKAFQRLNVFGEFAIDRSGTVKALVLIRAFPPPSAHTPALCCHPICSMVTCRCNL